MFWLFGTLLLFRLLAILITPMATATRHSFKMLYHIISSSSRIRLETMYQYVFSTHAVIHPVVSGTHSFVLMMEKNRLVNVIMLSLVVLMALGLCLLLMARCLFLKEFGKRKIGFLD